MIVRNVRHKGLRRFLMDDDAAGLPPPAVPKIRDILSFLVAMEAEEELRNLTMWKAHQMTGARAGTWSLHVTKNWRITFRIDHDEIEIIDLDYEDYH